MAEPVFTNPAPWWTGGTLRAKRDGIELAGRSVAALAEKFGTPLYLYDGARIGTQLAELRAALSRFERHRIFFALKSNRFLPVLELFRTDGGVGIDACSPREVALAVAAGFAAEEISVTASNLSPADLDDLARAAVHINFDQIAVLRRYGERVPTGTRIGLRIDPAVSAGYGVNSRTDYGGGKLGLALEDLDAALNAARAAGLVVDTLHLHLGWGLRESDEAAFRRALGLLAEAAKRVPTVDTINVGGGLGGRLRESDRPLRPERWATAIHDAFGSSGPLIACEPGTFLTAAAGLLVARVTSAWKKRGEPWLGLDCGQAVNVYAAHYGLELEIVSVRAPLASPAQRTHVAGHINEAGDVFARGRDLPELAEGDLVALLPAGAYGSSMASDHCLRGGFTEQLLWANDQRNDRAGFTGAGAAATPRSFPSRIATLPDRSRGLFATADLPAGTAVGRFEGPVMPWSEVPPAEVRYVIQVHDDGWMIPRSSIRFCNHSCAPNCALDAAFNVHTLRAVAAGEELTFSYDFLSRAEWQRAPEYYFWDERWSFDCRCGAPACVGRVDCYRISP